MASIGAAFGMQIGGLIAFGAFFALWLRDMPRGGWLPWISAIVGISFIFSGYLPSQYFSRNPATESVQERSYWNDLVNEVREQERKVAWFGVAWAILYPFVAATNEREMPRIGNFDKIVRRREEWTAERWWDKERNLEEFVLRELEREGVKEAEIYEWVCAAIQMTPSQLGLDDSYAREASRILGDAEWTVVYVLVESAVRVLTKQKAERFRARVNEHLRSEKIGWELDEDGWNRIGDPSFILIEQAVEEARTDGRDDAAEDLEASWRFLQSHQNANWKEALSSAMRSLEATVQDFTGSGDVNFTRIRWPQTYEIAPQLKGAVQSLYSYCSGVARHANATADIPAPQAAMVVALAAAMSTYLRQVKREQKDFGGREKRGEVNDV